LGIGRRRWEFYREIPALPVKPRNLSKLKLLYNMFWKKGAAERAWSRLRRSIPALNFAFLESIDIFPGFDNIPPGISSDHAGQTMGQLMSKSMGRLILSIRSGRQCAGILSRKIKDKCNHIAAVSAHMAAFADIIESYSRRASTVFEIGWNYFVLRNQYRSRYSQAS
jgi:hypothetical protein